MDRRLFLASSAASLPLAGCIAPRPKSVAVAPECLVPVNVTPGRVIRTVAGLRPYREEGFVVRAEPLGAKTLNGMICPPAMFDVVSGGSALV